jgi:hypothetical protein
MSKKIEYSSGARPRRARARSCLGLPKGIRESERLAAHLKRWEECGTKAGEFMVVREAEHEDEISTKDEEEDEENGDK